MNIGKKVIVFALEHYNPLGQLRSLGKMGINPIYISVKRKGDVASKSKYISKLHKVESVEEGYELLMEEYGNEHERNLPYLLFSDDRSVGFFDLHYDEWQDKFIAFNAGKQGRINKYMNKYEIQQLARKHGFNVLDSYVLDTENPIIPDNLEYPVITKDISPNSGAWKSDVHICQDEADLKSMIGVIVSPQIIVQHFVDKQNEMALEGYAIDHGREIQIVTKMNWKYLIQGYYSPFHDVTPSNDPDMENRLREMFKEIGFEGIFEVEFLIDKDGTYYFMEINFRASAWNSTGLVAGMPLSYLWVKGMQNGYIDPDDRKEFEPFTSMSEIIDYGQRVDRGRCSLGEWLKDFKEAQCTYIYDKDDIGPWEEVCKNWDNFK